MKNATVIILFRGVTLLISILFLITSLAAQEYNLTVLVKDTGLNPIEGAILFIDDDNEKVTDQTGTVIYSLSSGQYTLYSYAPDYLDFVSHITISEDRSYEIVHKEAVFWSTAPSNPPVAVGENNGVRLATAGGKVYFHVAYGGTPGMSNHSARPDFYVYDPQQDNWTQLTNAPHFGLYGISVAHGPTLAGDDAIYIIRGYWSGQRTWLARYSINQGTWETGLNYQIPWRFDLGNEYNGTGFQDYPRNGSVMIWDQDDHIYLFPGSSYNYEKYDWYRYSVSNDSWEDLGALPHKQGPGNAAILVNGDSISQDQDFIYAQFGITPSGTYTDAEFWRYGLSGGEWEKLADHGYGADDGSMLVWDGSNYIYHTPGAYEENQWDKGLSQKRKMMRYSIEGDFWTHMEDAPYNRWGGWDDAGGIVRVGDVIYGLKGGSDVYWAGNGNLSGGGGSPSDKFWSFTLHDNTHDLELLPSQGQGITYPSPGMFTFLAGTEADFLAIPDTGWRFEHWMVNGVVYSDEKALAYPVASNATLQAVFLPEGSNVHGIDQSQVSIYVFAGRLYMRSERFFERLSIYDVSGSVVSCHRLSNERSFQIELDVPAGVYIVRATDDISVVTKKIVVN